MAIGPGVNQGKTPFVAEFLSVNPDATLATVNEAWKSAGNEGTVSESLVGKTRSKLKSTGKMGTNGGSSEAITGSVAQSKPPKGTKSRGASKAKEVQSPTASRGGSTGMGKAAFVQEMLGQDPKANVKAINRAWLTAGNEGTISDSIFYKVKREQGNTGKRSFGKISAAVPKLKSSPNASKPERVASAVEATRSQSKGEHASPKTTATLMSQDNGHGRVLDEIEGEIDELMFRLKSLGGFAEVQEALRAARRLLVRSHGE
ncbi:hypothetical protein Sinac_6039 [Singulisphaera acidiphila DSM 18658]|uniref:Uncharacterized protein n=2 Tax=Singulisphaera acidiphila TaxID=466153 RepID=L0DL76_SINAD|nr:hypothetical protein Sinac_6039 [Singulisphaera acidiphila DSM 18658]